MRTKGQCAAGLVVLILLSFNSAQATGLHLPHFLVEIFDGIQALTAREPSHLAATHLFVQTASSAVLSRDTGLVLEDVPLSTKVVAYSKTGPSVDTKDNAEFISPAFTNPDGTWLGTPQAVLMGNYDGQKVVLLLSLDRPVYQPSEDRLAYTAVRTVSVDQSSLALANGAVNKLAEQYTKDDTHGAPLLLTAADIKDSLVLSDVSLFIDAAFVPAKHSSNRRWLQSTAAYAPAPAPSGSRQTGPPALPSWFAPGGPGNPVSRDNPTVIPGAPLPGYYGTGFAEPADATTSVSNAAATLASLPEAWAPGFAPGPPPGTAPAAAPGPADVAQIAEAAQEAPVRGANPVLCMTAAGPANCDTPSFGADGVGSLGGPITSGSSTSASGWNNYGYDVQARSYLPSGSPYSINRYQPRGGVWGPYHGSVNG